MPSNYAISAFNDPYFKAAYESPNYYQLAAQQSQQTPSFKAAQQTASTTAALPQQETKEAEDNSSAKKWVCGTILAVGAAALCIAAYRKGGANLEGLDKMKDGFKNMWEGVSTWFKSTTKTVADKISGNAEAFQVAERGNGIKVCQLPGQTNVLKGDNIIQGLEEIGASTEVKHLVDANGKLVEGSAIKDYLFNCQGINVCVENGKVKTLTENGKDVLERFAHPTEQADVNIATKIKELIEKVGKGEELDKLRKITYSNTENGLTKIYTLDKLGEVPKLIEASTKDFAFGSKDVNAYMAERPEVKEFVSAWLDGKLNLSCLKEGKLQTGIGTFVVKDNGEIARVITKDGIFEAGSVDFLDLKYKNPEIFENVPKRHSLFTERVYALAA